MRKPAEQGPGAPDRRLALSMLPCYGRVLCNTSEEEKKTATTRQDNETKLSSLGGRPPQGDEKSQLRCLSHRPLADGCCGQLRARTPASRPLLSRHLRGALRQAYLSASSPAA